MRQLQKQTPVLIMNNKAKEERGRQAQYSNISAAKAMADIISTTLGPRSMMKMLMDPMGGIVMTNDGHAILREIETKHPTAKSLIELARMQDEEVGDGTTSVVILTGEIMSLSRQFLEQNIHPTIIVSAYFSALDLINQFLEEISEKLDLENEENIKKILEACVGTKFSKNWGNIVVDLAYRACQIVFKGTKNVNKLSAEIKRYAKIEKIPGGLMSESKVINGVFVNKDLTHPAMRKKIENPRVILLDCPLEYKKGESQTNMEMSKDTDLGEALKQEMAEVAQMCTAILKFKPDVVITEKGVSDLAQHYLLEGNVSVIRRIRKTDNNRIARVTGAQIVHRPEDLQESDVGTECGLFEMRKMGDEYFIFFEECKNPSACSILLRGGSKDTLNEMERNLHDALGVARNVFSDPKLVYGGGATEMQIQKKLKQAAKTIIGLENGPFLAIAQALEVIPRTLSQNCGCDVIKVITELRQKHQKDDGKVYGVNGNSGKVGNMKEIGIMEPLRVKAQVIKTAIETCCMLLRIDDIISGIKKKESSASAPVQED